MDKPRCENEVDRLDGMAFRSVMESSCRRGEGG